MAHKITYRDIDISFIKHPLSGDVVTLTDDNAIKGSIELLLDMDFFETPMNPEKGSQVKRLLFEPMGIDVVIEIKEAIIEVLDKYEPRITVEAVNVEADYDDAVYEIEIVFKILNTINLKVVKFILSKVN